MPPDIIAPTRSALRIHLLISDEVVRRGVEALIRGMPALGEVTLHHGSAGPGAERTHPEEQPPGEGPKPFIRVLITTPDDADSWHYVRALVERFDAKTIVLLGDAADVVAAGRVPADGFLVQRQVTVSSLASALNQVLAGTVPMPASLARALLAGGGTRRGRAHSALTAREQVTVELLAEGLSNRQIGRRLGISEHGAKRLVTSVLIRLDASNRTAAVAEALRRGLITGRPRPVSEH